jgi:hypothetical protein
MTIHFTHDGIFADTEDERQIFYDKLCSGDPTVYAHVAIWERDIEIIEKEKHDNKSS